MLLNANGKPLLSTPDQETVEALQEAQKRDLAAFAEWQKAQNDGKGMQMPSLDAIGRASIVAVFRSLPPGTDGAYLQQCMNMLMQEVEAISNAKAAEARIRASLAANNEQAGPS